MVVRILLVLFILFAGMRTAAQSTNDFPDYPGGIDSLTKSLLKQMDGVLTSIDREYFMFFTISVQADGVITVNELFRKQDSTSRIVLDMIQKTAPRWKKLS